MRPGAGAEREQEGGEAGEGEDGEDGGERGRTTLILGIGFLREADNEEEEDESGEEFASRLSFQY